LNDLLYFSMNASPITRAILIPYPHCQDNGLKLYYFPTTQLFWGKLGNGNNLPKSPKFLPSSVKAASMIIEHSAKFADC